MFLTESYQPTGEVLVESVELNLDQAADIMTEAELAFASINEQAMLEQYTIEKTGSFQENADVLQEDMKATLARWWASIKAFFKKAWDGLVKFFTGLWTKLTGLFQNDIKFLEGLKEKCAEKAAEANVDYKIKATAHTGLAVLKTLDGLNVKHISALASFSSAKAEDAVAKVVEIAGDFAKVDGTKVTVDMGGLKESRIKAVLGDEQERDYKTKDLVGTCNTAISYMKASMKSKALISQAQKTIKAFNSGIAGVEKDSTKEGDAKKDAKAYVANIKVLTGLLTMEMSVTAKAIGASRSAMKSAVTKGLSA